MANNIILEVFFDANGRGVVRNDTTIVERGGIVIWMSPAGEPFNVEVWNIDANLPDLVAGGTNTAGILDAVTLAEEGGGISTSTSMAVHVVGWKAPTRFADFVYRVQRERSSATGFATGIIRVEMDFGTSGGQGVVTPPL